MEVIVLAGGFGTRLSHIVSEVPKPMAPVAGLPFLKYIVDDLVTNGMTHLIFAVSYKKEIIMEYFGKSYRGIPIDYSVEEKPLMTGGAIKQALSLCVDDEIFVINGDTYFSINFTKMQISHRQKHANATIAVKPMCNFERYGQVVYDASGHITTFLEKQFCQKGSINGGIYLLNKAIILSIQANAFSLENDFLSIQTQDKDIFAYVADDYFIDIGVPDDYYQAQIDFAQKGKPCSAAFFDRDGTINVNYGHVYKIEDLTLISGIGEIIHNYNKKGWPVIVITNQAGIAKGYYTETEMHNFNAYLNQVLQEKFNAHIDAFYFCPHHPNFTGKCSCRKPAPEMILRAQKEFNIDLSQSVFYGDTESDKYAAKAAGISMFIAITANTQ